MQIIILKIMKKDIAKLLKQIIKAGWKKGGGPKSTG